MAHVKANYTALAHYLLIKQTLNAKEWFFVSDDDSTLQSAIFRTFSDTFLSGYAGYFVCQSDKSLDIDYAKAEASKHKKDLIQWGESLGYRESTLQYLARKKLQANLKGHDFYNYKTVAGKRYPVRGSNPIEHPLPFRDEGHRYVNCISDFTSLTTDELARLILQVNNRTIDNFFQQIRRRILLLERPIVTARGDGKSYIYGSYNPKYAQYLVTILRTFYNFCWKTKYNNQILTPAMRLGIADKVYDEKDIIYFR